MWRKSEDSKPKSPPGASPSSVSSAPHSDTAAPKTSAGTPPAVSQGIKIKGEISGHGDLFLEGEFEGKIRIASGTLTVGPNARVRAEIEATEIIVRGEVTGTLKASELVQIWSTGKLTGDIETHGIVINDGAVLCGTVAVPQASLFLTLFPLLTVDETDHPPQPSSPEPPPRAKRAAGAS
jgi:cytoskeletal protein CcmA (bactofilin family)